jgi:hypothetical protein
VSARDRYAGVLVAPGVARLLAAAVLGGCRSASTRWPSYAAGGSALSGTLVELEGWRLAVVVGVAVATTAGAVAAARRRTLHPAPAL